MAARYQLPEGTYWELVAKPPAMTFLKQRLVKMRELRGLGEDMHRLPDDDAEQERVKAAAQAAAADGEPILVLAWQVQVTRYAHRLVDAPGWLTASPTTAVRVYGDDTCEPAATTLR